jgi:hypothetical protein
MGTWDEAREVWSRLKVDRSGSDDRAGRVSSRSLR